MSVDSSMDGRSKGFVELDLSKPFCKVHECPVYENGETVQKELSHYVIEGRLNGKRVCIIEITQDMADCFWHYYIEKVENVLQRYIKLDGIEFNQLSDNDGSLAIPNRRYRDLRVDETLFVDREKFEKEEKAYRLSKLELFFRAKISSAVFDMYIKYNKGNSMQPEPGFCSMQKMVFCDFKALDAMLQA